jgi:hypothetical protein
MPQATAVLFYVSAFWSPTPRNWTNSTPNGWPRAYKSSWHRLKCISAAFTSWPWILTGIVFASRPRTETPQFSRTS